MDDDGEDNELQSTLGFTYEDFSELNDIINLTATMKKFQSCTSHSTIQMNLLLDRVRNVALKEGYVTVIKRSKAGRYVIIGCDRGGKFRCTVPLDEMKRISATRLINCPFEVLGKKKVGKHPYLTVSTGNFREVREKICLAIDNQYNEIKTKVASEKIRVTHKFKIPMLKELVTHVSVFALGKLFKQCELARTDYVLGSCTGNFSRTMGLPCAHMMRNKEDGILRLGDIHPQWKIDTRSFTNMDGGAHRTGSEIECLLKNFHEKYKNMPLVQKEESLKQIALLIDAEIPLTLEPNIQPHKGRPLGSKKRNGDSYTTRHPSAFEIAEKTRKCGACQCVGHNRRTCPGNGESNSHNPHFVVANQDATLTMLETPFQCEISTSLGL
ncbi:hypothetical protein RHGRI_032289 [Rhododendron griersonianum]|uniref:Uncharacterized protein n=1 Tax=Rhododendron griersonianum TaxID=479676 RepID=A0AAV6IBQ9_9ERIC|nr:hypothetical protein RHGRI_032289 [Rhododendron griersonianum]